MCFCLFYSNQVFPAQEQKKEGLKKQIDSLSAIAGNDLIGNGDLLKKLINLSEEANYPLGTVKNLLNLGIYYANNSMIDSSNAVYDRSELIAKKHPDLEYTLSYVYNNKAVNLTNQNFHYQALKYFHKAHAINLKYIDKKMAIIAKMNMLGCHLELGEPDKVLIYSKELIKDSTVINQEDLQERLYANLAKAHFQKKEYLKAIDWWDANLKIVRKNNNKGEISYILSKIAESYIHIGNHKKALEKVIEGQKILENEPTLRSYKATNELILGKVYASIGQPKKAVIHFKNSIAQDPYDPIDVALAYKNLGNSYKALDDLRASSESYKLYGSIIDSLYTIRNKDISKISEGKIELIEEEYRNSLLKRDYDILTYKNEKQKWYIISLSIGLSSLLLVVISIVLYKKYDSRTKQVEELREKEKKILRNNLKNREEEFLATMISVNERLNKLSSIKQYLSTAIKYENKIEILEVEKQLEQFITSTSDLNILKDRIESKYPGITSKINTLYPDLSINDIRHCLLVNLNMSIKESAQLLNVSTHAVKMARKRVKKKIDIPEDVSLKDHLQAVIL